MSETRTHRDNVPAARALRGDSTPSEELLWEQLRDRRFRGLKFRRQHPVGPFVVDFYYHELKLAIEVDGAVHTRVAVAARDRDRQLSIQEQGIHVVRVRAAEVEADPAGALERLLDALTPNPSPTRRGETEG